MAWPRVSDAPLGLEQIPYSSTLKMPLSSTFDTTTSRFHSNFVFLTLQLGFAWDNRDKTIQYLLFISKCDYYLSSNGRATVLCRQPN